MYLRIKDTFSEETVEVNTKKELHEYLLKESFSYIGPASVEFKEVIIPEILEKSDHVIPTEVATVKHLDTTYYLYY